MKCYIITYDLRKPGRNYQTLYEAIKSFGTWGKINESTWAIVSSLTSYQIYEFLSKHIDSNDRIFIIKSGGDATWLNAIAENDWLKKHLILK